MAEIQEVVKDTTNTIKKKFKEKPVFYTALGCVIVFAIYKLFSGSETVEEETVTNAYVPMGYDGYPTISDSMLEDYNSMLDGSYEGSLSGGTTSGGILGGLLGSGETVTDGGTKDDYVYDYFDDYQSMVEQYEDLQEEMILMQQNQLILDSSDPTAVYDNYGNLIYSEIQPYQVITDDSTYGRVQLELETKSNKDFYNAVVEEMRENSALWNATSSVQEREELNKQNQQLAKYIGATYDSGSGTWYASDGSKLYDAPKSTTVISYDKNVDYAAAIKQAKANGASQSVIDQLTAQRNAKIAGENLNSDGTKKSSGSSGSSSSTSYGGVSYDKNTDYAQKIKDAKASGASQSVISNLQAQREAKIKGENLNNDGTKKS